MRRMATPMQKKNQVSTVSEYLDLDDVAKTYFIHSLPYPMTAICAVCKKRYGSHVGLSCPNRDSIFIPASLSHNEPKKINPNYAFATIKFRK